MSEEWGPWIEHDGGPRPVPRGTYCHAVFDTGLELIGPVGRMHSGDPGAGSSWEWAPHRPHIIRYRIRKPRALIELIEMVENLPAPTERVDA